MKLAGIGFAFTVGLLTATGVASNELPMRLDANTVLEAVESRANNRIDYTYTINLKGTEMAASTSAEIHDQLHGSVFATCFRPEIKKSSSYRFTFRYNIPERNDVKVFELTPSSCQDYRSKR